MLKIHTLLQILMVCTLARLKVSTAINATVEIGNSQRNLKKDQVKVQQIVAGRKLNSPDFFLLGAQKCGSTSLFKLMTQMRAICTPLEKEPKYFCSDVYKRGVSFYEGEVFSTCKDGEFQVDGSVGNFHRSMVQSRMLESYTQDDLAKKKFVLLMRDEISREFSWYKHQVRNCAYGRNQGVSKPVPAAELCSQAQCQLDYLGCKSFNASDLEKISDPVKRLNTFEEYYHSGGVHLQSSPSNYLGHIKAWLEIIDRDQLFIIHMDELTHNTTETMKRISSFLGIEYDLGAHVELPRANEANVDVFVTCETLDEMLDYYRHANAGLKQLVNKHHAPFEPYFPGFVYAKRACTDLKVKLHPH